MTDKSRYRLTQDELQQSSKNNLRIQKTLEFVNTHKPSKALDIGERNPLTPLLEKKFDIKIENTSIDLDEEKINDKFDTIFCFEVLEHLMNPLFFLKNLRNTLDDNGVLFLSTPTHKPHFLWDKHHFTEYDFDRLKNLLNRSGFKIIKYQKVRTRPIWWHLTGLRPFIRLFINKSIILELRKA